MHEHDFKLGDRVVIISSDGFFEENITRVGTIGMIDETNLPIRVDFEVLQYGTDDNDWGRPSGLKLLEEVKARVQEPIPVVEVCSEKEHLNLLTPAQLRVYNAAVKLSEAQVEFTKAIDAHHAELQGK